MPLKITWKRGTTGRSTKQSSWSTRASLTILYPEIYTILSLPLLRLNTGPYSRASCSQSYRYRVNIDNECLWFCFFSFVFLTNQGGKCHNWWIISLSLCRNLSLLANEAEGWPFVCHINPAPPFTHTYNAFFQHFKQKKTTLNKHAVWSLHGPAALCQYHLTILHCLFNSTRVFSLSCRCSTFCTS